jgi:Leucine-rich repeat (LRR) protein
VLAHNPISDLEKLNSMKSLQYLDIQGIESSEIVDFSELKTLPDFEFLK